MNENVCNKINEISDKLYQFGLEDVLYSVLLSFLIKSNLHVTVDSEQQLKEYAILLEKLFAKLFCLKAVVVHINEKTSVHDLTKLVQLGPEDQSPASTGTAAANKANRSASLARKPNSTFGNHSFSATSTGDYALAQPFSVLAPIKSLVSLSPTRSNSQLNPAQPSRAMKKSTTNLAPIVTNTEPGNLTRTLSIGDWFKRIPSMFAHGTTSTAPKNHSEKKSVPKAWSKLTLFQKNLAQSKENKSPTKKSPYGKSAHQPTSPLRHQATIKSLKSARFGSAPYHTHHGGLRTYERMPSLLRVFTTLENSGTAESVNGTGLATGTGTEIPPIVIICGAEKAHHTLQLCLAEFVHQRQFLPDSFSLIACLFPSSDTAQPEKMSLHPRFLAQLGVALKLSRVQLEAANHALDIWGRDSSTAVADSSVSIAEIQSLKTRQKTGIFLDFSVDCYVKNLAYAFLSNPQVDSVSTPLLASSIESAAKALASILDQSYVTPLEVQAVLYKTLPHQIKLLSPFSSALAVIDDIVSSLPVPY